MAAKVCGWYAVLLSGLAFLLLTGCGGSSSTSNNVTATPSFSPGGGTYNTSQTVTISDSTRGAVLYCTTDGTAPTSSSPKCSQPTTVFQSEFLQAIAVAPGMKASAVVSAGYTINLSAAPTPTFSPAGGIYSGAQTVTISDATSGANIYYTTDGSVPSASSTLYTSPVTISKTATLSAIAIVSGNSNSGVASATYTIQTLPTITGLSPSSAIAGGAAFTLTVNGTNFVSGATINWNGAPLATTFVSATQLTAAAPANLIASPGTASVTVTTPAGTSPGNAFTINPASVPTITTLSPSSATAGSAAFTLTVSGTNFASGAVVNWATTALATTYVSATQLTAAVPASLIASAGTAAITVAEPAGTSAAATFTINAAPAPTIASLSPSSAIAGDAGFTLTVNGTNFTSSAVVNWASTALTTTYVSATQLTAAVPASLIASAGSASITVSEPAGSSVGATFAINAPGTPTITSLSPNSITAGGSAFTLTVNGANYVPSAVVNWGGVALTTTYVGPTQLTAAIPGNLIATAGPAIVTVSEAGENSSGATFTVSPALPQITGTVVSGAGGSSMPLGGAAVQLYAAGTSVTGAAGYGQAAAAVGSAVSTASGTGAFSVSYDCSALTAPGDLLYLVATATNSEVVLMTVLGPCSGLSASGVTVTINEATTVASAYSLAQFMTTAPNVGAPASNYLGLSNAFATVNNLVNTATGAALSITPAYANNSTPFLNTSTAPQMRLNTLANILNACASTNGSACSSLWTAATPPSGTAPSNTLQAILDIAQNPGSNVSALFGLLASSPPFSPDLPSAPNDWTLALTFTGGGLGISPNTSGNDSAGQTGVGPTINASLAIDANGNVWVAGYGEYGYQSGSLAADLPILAKFNNLGAALTPATTLSNAPTPVVTFGGYNLGKSVQSGVGLATIALDANGNIWAGDPTSNGSLFTVSPGLSILASGVAAATGINALAIDNNNNAWIGYNGNLGEFTYSSGNSALQAQTLSAEGGVGYGQLTDLIFDSGLNLWGADEGNDSVYQISTTDGSVLYDSFPFYGGNFEVSLAADSAGNVYGCGDPAGNILDVFTVGAIANNYTLGSRGCGEQLLLDGQGHLFAISNGFGFPSGAAIDEYTTTGTVLSPLNGYTGTSAAEPATITRDSSTYLSFFPTTAAIDGSGNLWVVNENTSNAGAASGSPATGNVLVEFVGMAAPVVTPTAVALVNGQLGVRP